MSSIKKFKPSKKNIKTAAIEKVFYSTMNTRLETMKFAPKSIKRMALKLARTGFFYGNYADYVRCHSCQTRFGKWINDEDPAELHTRVSPHCQYLRMSNIKKTHTLQDAIMKNLPKLLAELYFQAVARLRHYQIFPTMVINDVEIDASSSDTWHNTIHPSIKKSYLEIQQRSLQIPDSRKKPLLHPLGTPDSALEWYHRTLKMRHWATHGSLEHLPDNAQIKKLWTKMDKKYRQTFINLHTLDTKRFTTKKIEDVFASQGLSIGLEVGSSENVVVSIYNENRPLQPISQKLAQKIARLSIPQH